jgi:hypothetical protein
MTVVAVGILLIAISSFFGFDYVLSYFDSINVVNAEQTVDNIVSGTNLVYSQGIGSVTRTVVTIPSGLILNRTYLSDTEINMRFSAAGGFKDVFKNAAVNLTGSIPIREGKLTLFIKMELNREAVIYIDGPVSYILLDLFNDSARTQEDTSFANGETVYYSIYLFDFDGNAIDSDVAVSVYRPDMSTFHSNSGTTTGGSFNDSFVISDAGNAGQWLFSVVETDAQILGTRLFDKS